MPFDRFEDFETTAVLTLGIVFSVWEVWRPAHAIRRRDDWKRDALGLIVLVIGVNLSRLALRAAMHATGLDVWLAGMPWRRWPAALQLAIAVPLLDFCLYWVHRLMHTELMWRSHKWHHSVETMYWFAGSRTSLVHGFLFAIPQVAIAFYVFRFSALQIGILSGLGIFVQYFIHSNLHVPLGPLEWLVVTPQNHRRHHAFVEGVPHGNYATIFAFWDRIFGTHVDWRALPQGYPLGLGERDNPVRMSIGL